MDVLLSGEIGNPAKGGQGAVRFGSFRGGRKVRDGEHAHVFPSTDYRFGLPVTDLTIDSIALTSGGKLLY